MSETDMYLMDWKTIIDKQEAMYIFFASVFALVWFVVLLPVVTGIWGTNFAILQFLLFNIGMYFFFFIFLKTIITDTKFNFKTSLGFMFLFIALDLWMPEYHVTVGGQLLTGASMGVASSDYIVGLLGKTVGIPGIALFLFTYLLIPVVFLLVAAKILPNFVKKL